MNTIRDFATSFPSVTLHAVNLLLWRKILSHYFQSHYSNQTKHTRQGAFYGGSRFATQGGTGEGSEPPHQKIESSPFPYSLSPSRSWLQIIYCKKSLIAFTQILPKILPVVLIFSFIIMAYFKKFIGIKSHSTKLTSIIITLNFTPCIAHLIKNLPPTFILLVVPTIYRLPYPFPQTLGVRRLCRCEAGGGGGGERIPPCSRKMLISHTRKIHLPK